MARYCSFEKKKMQRGVSQVRERYVGGEMAGRFGSLHVLKKQVNAGDAEALLRRLALEVEPIMQKRNWFVGKLEEFCPKNDSLLGMNCNRGQKILIRLRRSDGSFLEWVNCVGTMLHELVHNVHGGHSAQFYKMLDELWEEYESGAVRVSQQVSQAFQGRGQKLQNKNNVADIRSAAAQAAERRIGSSGVGERAASGLRERVRLAAEARRKNQSTCVAVVDGVQLKEEQEGGGNGAKDTITAKQRESQKNTMWSCYRCTLVNSSSCCAACGCARDSSKHQSEWQCSNCTLKNNGAVSTCEVCLQPRRDPSASMGNVVVVVDEEAREKGRRLVDEETREKGRRQQDQVETRKRPKLVDLTSL